MHVSVPLQEAPALLHASSLTAKRWRLRDLDDRVVSAIRQQQDIPEMLARLLVARGVTPETAMDFLSPSLKASLTDPCHLLDMPIAAERIASAVIAGEKIAIFGDYDVDGATSSALLARYLRMLGREALIYIPDRLSEGYGPNTKALLSLKAQGASVVITVDCGTLAFEPIEAATNAGLDVIVVDHHQGEARKPTALAVVNPNRMDETSPCNHLAAVGVAFLLAIAVNRALRQHSWFVARPEPDLRTLLDLVALGTVCDVVPLTGLNRAYVAQGLKVIAARSNLGLRTLLDVARADETPNAYTCGFLLGPRVNAGGRVGRADIGARLLSTDDPAEALTLAQELNRYNDERKSIESLMLDEALEQAEAQSDAPLLIVHSERWHPGVIGIIAGRLKERTHKPVAAIAFEGGVGKASARSVTGFDFGAAVIAAHAAGLLMGGGGHAMAAGFTVEEGKLAALQDFLTARLARVAGNITEGQEILLDGCLGLNGASVELARMLEQAGPYGSGHPQAKFALQRVKLAQVEPVGTDHLRLICTDSGGLPGRLTAMAFRAASAPLGIQLIKARGHTVDLAGSLKLDRWNGRESACFHVEDAAYAS